jgi:carbon-monoxide dehydrogenase large subunit
VLSPTNPLGIKAGGEGGTTGALAAIVSAVVDALKPYDIVHIDMPATPYRVWQAIQRAKGRALTDPAHRLSLWRRFHIHKS